MMKFDFRGLGPRFGGDLVKVEQVAVNDGGPVGRQSGGENAVIGMFRDLPAFLVLERVPPDVERARLARDVEEGFPVGHPHRVSAAGRVLDRLGECLGGQIVDPETAGLGTFVSFSVGFDAAADEEHFFAVRRVSSVAGAGVEEETFVFRRIEGFFEQAEGPAASEVAIAADKENGFGRMEIFKGAALAVKGQLFRAATNGGNAINLIGSAAR